MSLYDAITAFQTGTYTVLRFGVDAYVNGVLSPASRTPISIAASVQPITGRMLDLLPEGQRADETKAVFTTTQLYTRDVAHDPDRIFVDGDAYRVLRVDTFQAFGGNGSGNFYRALVVRDTQDLTIQSSNVLGALTLVATGVGY